MLSFSKKNIFILLASFSMLLYMIYFMYTQENSNILTIIYGLLALVTVPLIVSKIERTLQLIILLAPMSMGVLLPFIGFKISVPSELLAAIITITFIVKVTMGLKVNSKILRHPISIILGLDLTWTLFVALYSSDMEVSLKRFALRIAFVFVFYFLFANYFNTEKKQRNFFLLYLIGCIIPIANAILVNLKLGFGQASSFIIGKPFFADHTIYGACIAFVLPFLLLHLGKKNNHFISWKYWIIPFTLLIVFAEFQSYSRASWISLIICLAFFIATKLKLKGYHMASILGLLIFIVSLNFNSIYSGLSENEVKYDDNVGAHLTSVTNLQNDASNLERINRWVCAYRMFEERPITGFGPGTYQFEYDKFQSAEFMTRISTHHGNRGNAHSEYLTYLAEYGFLGFLFFLLIIFYAIHTGLKLIYNKLITHSQKLLVYSALLGLITFFSHGLFNTFSDYEKMGVLIYGCLGILVNLDLKLSSNEVD